MSDRPDFAGVLTDHREDALTCYDHPPTVDHPVWCCVCGEHGLTVSHRAHLTAALNAELDRWLGNEGTRERVARAIDPEAFEDDWYDDVTTARTSATAALAALTTADPKDAR